MVFFVTGGSRGIGAAIVREAVREGHDVAFTYRSDEASARKVLEDARSIAPERRVHAYQLDVTDSKAVEEVGDRALDDLGSIDVVVSNAGIHSDNLAVTMSDEEWHAVIATNLTGAFYVARQFLPTMLGNQFGRIIFMSSVSAGGVTGQANYAASKAGLIGLSSVLAKEYGRKGITSNVLSLGFVDTDMTGNEAVRALREFWIKYCPRGRVARVEEIAGVVTFLASEKASFINGQTIPVNGGLDWAP